MSAVPDARAEYAVIVPITAGSAAAEDCAPLGAALALPPGNCPLPRPAPKPPSPRAAPERAAANPAAAALGAGL